MSDDDRRRKLQNKLKELHDRAEIGTFQVTSDIPTTAVAVTSGASGQLGSDGRVPIGPAVNQALANSLGWSWKPRDTAGFLSALRAGWTIGETAGVRVTERYQIGTAFAHDLGAVSGAQAILFAEVGDAAQRILPELKALEPLKVAPNWELVESIRAIVVAEVEDLATAFARPDGPILQHVDEVLGSLIGGGTNDPEEPDAGSDLGQMKAEFGFDRSLVNSVEQELVLSRWLAVVSRLYSLNEVYGFQRKYLASGATPDGEPPPEPYLGTQFVLISRALEVLRTSVREFRAALQAHFIDDAETDNLELRVATENGNGTERLFLGALLDWAESYPAEAIDLLRDAGKTGIPSVIASLAQLGRSAEAARPTNVDGFAFPILYQRSPIVDSTQAAFEASIYKTLDLLYELDPNGSAQDGDGNGDGDGDSGVDGDVDGGDGGDGNAGIDLKMEHVQYPGKQIGALFTGLHASDDLEITLRHSDPKVQAPDDIKPKWATEGEARLAVFETKDLPEGRWIIEGRLARPQSELRELGRIEIRTEKAS